MGFDFGAIWNVLFGGPFAFFAGLIMGAAIGFVVSNFLKSFG